MKRVVVTYDCKACGITDARVTVDARDPEQDVIQWVERVAGRCAHADHVARSPMCRSSLVDLKLPLPNDSRGIGCAPKH